MSRAWRKYSRIHSAASGLPENPAALSCASKVSELSSRPD